MSEWESPLDPPIEPALPWQAELEAQDEPEEPVEPNEPLDLCLQYDYT